MHQEKNLERFANATEKFLNVKIQNIKIKKFPHRGIEPRSPAWQAGILTTILPNMVKVLKKVGYKLFKVKVEDL